MSSQASKSVEARRARVRRAALLGCLTAPGTEPVYSPNEAISFCIKGPTSAIVEATLNPARRQLSILACAVSASSHQTAPACPYVKPCSVFCPAMNPTTGLAV